MGVWAVEEWELFAWLIIFNVWQAQRLQGHPSLPCVVLQTGIHPSSLQTLLLHSASYQGSGSPYPLYINMPHLLQIPDPPPRPSMSSTHISWTPKTVPHLFSTLLLPLSVPEPQSPFFTPSLKSLPSYAHIPHSSSILSPHKTLPSLSQSRWTGHQIFDFLQNQMVGTRRVLL